MAITNTTGETFPEGASVVTATKLNNIVNNMTTTMATAKVLGRTTASTGAVEELGTLPTAVQDNITRLGTVVSCTGLTTTGVLTQSAANPSMVGGTSAGSTSWQNVAADSYVTIYGGTHATLANKTQFVNGGSLVGSFSSTGLALTGTLSASGAASVADTTDASSSTTGSLKTAGGLGVAKKLYVGTDITAPFIKQSVGNCQVSSDFTVSASTTPVDVTGLSVSLAAGETYSFESVLFGIQSSSGGYTIGIGGTATATDVYGSFNVLAGGGSGTWSADVFVATPRGLAVPTSGSMYNAIIRGTITVNVAGTFTITFAQASATGTSTVKRGSYLTVRQY